MLFKFYIWSRKFCSIPRISKIKSMNLDKCYFRYDRNEDKIDITFLFKIKNSLRQYNFIRKPTESLETLNMRIGSKIQKIMNKACRTKSDEVVHVQFYDNKNNPVPEKATCSELFSLQEPVQLKIHDHDFQVLFNSPWVVSVNLPQSILSGFPIYPENYITLYTDDNKSIFNWYKGLTLNEKGKTINDNCIKWELVGTGFIYTPTAKDIGMKLKLECIPVNTEHTGPALETMSKNVVEAGPGYCPFETRHAFTATKLRGKSFRCISYNILADLYCDSDYTRTVLHPYCPSYALHIDYRKQLIIKELLGYNGDIICLQEVDNKIFQGCLKQVLGKDSFKGLFYKKGKEVAEGLVCFYREDRFSFLEDEHILLSQALKTKPCLEPIWGVVKNNTPLLERLLDRTTAASATILQSHDNPDEILIVGNTHLYFHPDADHIRLIQGGIVIYWLQDVKNSMMCKYPNKRISLIICGDFNSVPSCGIYQLYTTGSAPSSLADWTSNAEEAVQDLSLQQNLLLGSACGTPKYTNFTALFADCLDYIYYEKTSLEVEQIVPFPSVEELQAHTALPSIVFPSDHVALVSDLTFKQ